MRLDRLLRAIVVGVSAPALAACDDASIADGGITAGDSAPMADAAAVDAYIAWCDAGPPELVLDEGCDQYVYVPCGIPPSDPVDDASTIAACAPICPGTPDDVCGVLHEPWIDIVYDASAFDPSRLTEAGVLVLCACTGNGGRRPAGLAPPELWASSALGAHFARMAHLESASVPAFARLRRELATLGARPRLLAAISRAERDERRHAAMIGRLAARFGGGTHAPRLDRSRARDVAEIARENATEGVVNETFAALSAAWQSVHAGDPAVRRAMTRIAADEARHAALAFRVARFLAPRLSSRERAAVSTAERQAIDALHAAAAREPRATLTRVAGVPRAAHARALVEGADRFVWDSHEARA